MESFTLQDHQKSQQQGIRPRARGLVAQMSLDEKIGQLVLLNGAEGEIPDELRAEVAAGRVGGILNEVNVETVSELQRVARVESRLGIPLLMGRDVIHGFHRISPIPLGQAATWNPELVEACARVSALEAANCGVNWALAPMLDIGRDPRWGRVAESFGEDPLLTGILGSAMVRGLQGENLSHADSLLACVKHFAGYGATESGRDYNTTAIPEIDLRQLHLPPFKACLDAGALSLMCSFSDLNGVPATANEFLLKQILRDEWGYRGFVVSDWEAISQLIDHGLCQDEREAAREASRAGVDMEMYSTCYRAHLQDLLASGEFKEEALDEMVCHILEVKLQMGLMDGRADHVTLDVDASELEEPLYQAALQSVVLLKNEEHALPLIAESLKKLAVIGPMADEAVEQLGTWVFDGKPERSVTPLKAIREHVSGRFEVLFEPGLEYARDRMGAGIGAAVQAASAADAVLLFLGEEAILSGEAHCLADIRLQGKQEELLRRVCASGTPVTLVLLAGRPLALQDVVDLPKAILFAWHPGSMGGIALKDLLFGVESPSGKLPMTFPRVTGQVPVYYSHKNTGRPGTPEMFTPIDEIPRGAIQHSTGNTSHHLDAGYTPLFSFGHGLSYSEFEYQDLQLASDRIECGSELQISVTLSNGGERAAEEVVQVYVRDLVASVTRPVKELKTFRRVRLDAGETRQLCFKVPIQDLAFIGRDMKMRLETGQHRVWVGGSSEAELSADFQLV